MVTLAVARVGCARRSFASFRVDLTVQQITSNGSGVTFAARGGKYDARARVR
jgi:hypothetical protein